MLASSQNYESPFLITRHNAAAGPGALRHRSKGAWVSECRRLCLPLARALGKAAALGRSGLRHWSRTGAVPLPQSLRTAHPPTPPGLSASLLSFGTPGPVVRIAVWWVCPVGAQEQRHRGLCLGYVDYWLSH